MRNTLKLLTFSIIAVCPLLSFSQSNSPDPRLALRADSLARAYKNRTFKFDSALFYARRSLAVNRKLNDKVFQVRSLLLLGEVYHVRKKYKEALAVFREGATISKQQKLVDLEKASYEHLITTSIKADNYREAYYYRGLITRIDEGLLRDSLARKSAEIADLKARYAAAQVENENKVLKQQQQIRSLSATEEQLEAANEEYLRIAMIILGMLVLVVIIMLISRYRIKRRLNRERKTHAKEAGDRLAIAKDIREDIGLELAKINFFSQEVYYKPTAQDTKRNISAIIEISARLMENTRDLVWQLNAEDTTLRDLLTRIRHYGTDFFQDLSVEIIFRYPEAIPEVDVQKIAYRNIFMAVKEILHSIVKHARAMNVDVSVSLNQDYLNITIRDDGVGYDRRDESIEEGIQKLKSRIQAIGGLLNITNEEQGTTVRMDVRISQIVRSL